MVSLLALLPYPVGTTPSQRFRIEQWEPMLVKHGIQTTLVPFVDPPFMEILHRPGHRLDKALLGVAALSRRFAALGRSSQFEVILIHRAAALFGPAFIERLLARTGARIVFDFDDAIWLLHTTAANRWLGWLKTPGKTATLCRLCHAVVVANSGLADYARRYNPEVTVIPSSVDTDMFRPAARARAPGPIRVGWTGSSTSLTYLEMFAPTLRELVLRHRIELHVHSDRVPELADIPLVWHRWSADSEVEELSRFDVGIMPMPENEWARGKSAMKALLYMAMGIPAVCSPVGTNLKVIRHEENGLLARTTEEWLEAVGRLAEDAGLRARLGRAGRETVEQGYSKQHCAALFAGVVREVLG